MKKIEVPKRKQSVVPARKAFGCDCGVNNTFKLRQLLQIFPINASGKLSRAVAETKKRNLITAEDGKGIGGDLHLLRNEEASQTPAHRDTGCQVS